MLLNDFLPFSCLSKVATVFAFYNTLCSNQLSLEELLTNKTYSQSSVGLISVTSAQEKKTCLRLETFSTGEVSSSTAN